MVIPVVMAVATRVVVVPSPTMPVAGGIIRAGLAGPEDAGFDLASVKCTAHPLSFGLHKVAHLDTTAD